MNHSFVESIAQFIPIFAVLSVVYFLLIRPQQKKLQQHQEMLKGLAVGQRVETSGGLLGTVQKIQEHEISLLISQDVVVQVKKGSIVSVMTTPPGQSPALRAEKRPRGVPPSTKPQVQPSADAPGMVRE